MQSIILNSEQISKLVRNKYLEIFKDNFIEFQKDKLILNASGEIYSINAINLKFIKNEIDNKHKIDYLQSLICEHLNLKPHEVIYSKSNDDEFEFIIRPTPKQECQIVVCENRRAIQNFRALNDQFVTINLNESFIGIYKRLGDSAYYFRWFENI